MHTSFLSHPSIILYKPRTLTLRHGPLPQTLWCLYSLRSFWSLSIISISGLVGMFRCCSLLNNRVEQSCCCVRWCESRSLVLVLHCTFHHRLEKTVSDWWYYGIMLDPEEGSGEGRERIESEADWKSKSSWVVPSVVFGLVEWLTRASCKCEVPRASIDRNTKCLLSVATHMHVRFLSHIHIFDSHPQNAYFSNDVYDCWISLFLKKNKNDGWHVKQILDNFSLANKDYENVWSVNLKIYLIW